MPYIKRHRIPVCSRSGIYKITNRVNGKVYVGSSVHVEGRLKSHVRALSRQCHDNGYLQHSWNKHGGKDFFDFDILEECGEGVLLEREQHWIDTLDSTNRDKGYNICLTTMACMAGRNHSEESKAKMREIRKGTKPSQACVDAATAATKGIKKSDEFRRNLSEKQKGVLKSESHKAKIKATHWSKREDAAEIIAKTAEHNRGKKHSDEHKAKIGASHWTNRPDAAEIRTKMVAKMKETKRLKKLQQQQAEFNEEDYEVVYVDQD